MPVKATRKELSKISSFLCDRKMSTPVFSVGNQHLYKKYRYVEELSNYLKNRLSNIDDVVINSNENCIPHIVNISVLGIKPETMLHALEEKDIYISTKTACSKDSSDSLALTTIGCDSSISGHSIRISISHLTTKEEINSFVENLKNCIQKLRF